jgi:hypothetical protein
VCQAIGELLRGDGHALHQTNNIRELEVDEADALRLDVLENALRFLRLGDARGRAAKLAPIAWHDRNPLRRAAMRWYRHASIGGERGSSALSVNSVAKRHSARLTSRWRSSA